MRQRVALTLILASCTSPDPRVTLPEDVGRTRLEILASNRLVSNRLVSNRLVSNRLVSNRLVSNALVLNRLVSNSLVASALTSTEHRLDGLTEGEVSRELLGYIYSCAMPVGASMKLDVDGTSYGTLQGAVGLAPEWGEPDGSCAESCQRRVTACLLARTNFWGVPVAISLRGNHPGLVPGEAEKRDYPLREGAYFGNLFGNGGTDELFACSGPGSNVPQLTNRFCSGGQGVCLIRVSFQCVNGGRTLTRPGADEPQNNVLNTRFACRRQDPNEGSILDCYTGGVSLYDDDPLGKRFDEAITVYLKGPVAICGDGVCTGAETPDSCPSDCSTGWAVSAPGLENLPYGMARLPDGDLLVMMSSGDTTNLGGDELRTLPGELSIILARLGPSGQHRTSRILGYAPTGQLASNSFGQRPLRTDSDGNAYFFGYYGERLWIDDRPLELPPAPEGEAQAGGSFLVKVAPGGSVSWVRSWRGFPIALFARADGLPVVANLVSSGSGASETRMTTVSAAGATLDELTVPVYAPTPLKPLAVAPDGSVLLTRDSFFGDLLLVRYDPSTGRFEELDTPAGEPGFFLAVTVAPDGDVVAASYDFSGTPGSPIGALFRYAPDGRLLWHKPLYTSVSLPGYPDAQGPTGLVKGIEVNGKGEILVLGGFSTPMDIENEIFIPAAYQPSRSMADIWLAHYDAAGKLLWSDKLGGGGHDIPSAAILDDDGTIFVTGGFSETGVFGGRILENPSGGGDQYTMETFVMSVPPRASP